MKKYYIYEIIAETHEHKICLEVEDSNSEEVAEIQKLIEKYNGKTWESAYGKATASLYEVEAVPKNVFVFSIRTYLDNKD